MAQIWKVAWLRGIIEEGPLYIVYLFSSLLTAAVLNTMTKSNMEKVSSLYSSRSQYRFKIIQSRKSTHEHESRLTYIFRRCSFHLLFIYKNILVFVPLIFIKYSAEALQLIINLLLVYFNFCIIDKTVKFHSLISITFFLLSFIILSSLRTSSKHWISIHTEE